MPQLKAQLHIHTKEDPADYLKTSAKQVIDHAAKLGYEVLAITCHNVVIHNDDLAKYAEEKRILLIPGIEKTIEKKHVIILNATVEAQNIKDFNDLKLYKKKNPGCLIMAAHPFYPFYHYKKTIDKYPELFEAIEYSWYHSKRINKYNNKATEVAEKHGITLVGTSDNHLIKYFDHTFSTIDAPKKETLAILQAIRDGNVAFTSHNLSFFQLIGIWLRYMRNISIKKILLK